MNFSWLKSKKGFTLAEMLVVMFIFSILSVTLAGIFVQFFNAERLGYASQKISSDMRFTLEMIAREVRMGNVDYRLTGYYGGTVPSPTDTLALLDSDDNQTLFGLAGVDCETTNDCYVFVRRGGTDYRITPDDIAVNKLIFYVSPAADPFTLQLNPLVPATYGTYLADAQPRVIILLEEKDTRTGAVVIRMQTAVSSKIYKR
jgi:prepilin-type N-terminal cleavage/methylation domain-containing protein